jgi:hypothetical protein
MVLSLILVSNAASLSMEIIKKQSYSFNIGYFADDQDKKQEVYCNTPLSKACLDDNIDTFKLELKAVKDKESELTDLLFSSVNQSAQQKAIAFQRNAENNVKTLCDCIVVAVYNNRSSCIKELSPSIQYEFEALGYIHLKKIYLNLLLLAMRQQKKDSFEALIENDQYFFVPENYRKTMLEIMLGQKDISNEYIELYKKLRPINSGCNLF